MDTTPDAVTPRTVLFDRPGELADLLHRERATDDTLGHFTDLPAAADHEIAYALNDVLDVGLGSHVLSTWNRLRELRSAGMRTLSGGREIVVLAKHEIAVVQRPTVDVTMNGYPVARLHFTVSVDLEFDGVAAVVASGLLTALRFGDCTLDVTLALDSVGTIAERQREFPVGRVVPLCQPMPLCTRTQRGSDAQPPARHR